MKYIFLIAALWNFFGGINFLFKPQKQAKDMGYPMGNMWEAHYIAIMAFVFAALYAMIFLKMPQGYLFFVPFFAAAKYLIGISALYCVKKHNMPVRFAAVFGGGNFIMGMLFTVYLLVV